MRLQNNLHKANAFYSFFFQANRVYYTQRLSVGTAAERTLRIGGIIYMKGQMQTDLGQIVIDEEVIAKYAGINALECFGIVGMASVNMKDGLVKLLKRDNLCKGVRVKVQDNKIYIDFHIIVVYGVSIATVTENLIQSVKYRVEKFTNMDVEKINIYVEGVRIVD